MTRTPRPGRAPLRALLLTTVTGAVGLALAAPSAVAADSMNPPSSPQTASAAVGTTARTDATVTAVVVKSWGGCSSSSLIWDQLNATWAEYGSIEVVIDYADPALCGGTITLDALEASGADVVILSDPSGASLQYAPAEVDALAAYAEQGHNLVGTYLVFTYPAQGIDNSALAPLFGLRDDAGWVGGDLTVDPTYTMTKKAKSLKRGLPKPWTSSGYNQSQRPADGKWSKNDLTGAKIVGSNPDKSSAITAYKGDGYRAVFVGTMVEYLGGTNDLQFFYNAVTYPKKK